MFVDWFLVEFEVWVLLGGQLMCWLLWVVVGVVEFFGVVVGVGVGLIVVGGGVGSYLVLLFVF